MKTLPGIFKFYFILAFIVLLFAGCDSQKDNSLSPQAGVGGSMARFAINGNTLYIVSRQTLEVYDITDGASPVKSTRKDIGIGIETIFPYQNYLFVGGSNGMYIFDNKTPGNPSLLSTYTHIQSCDPVVAQGNFAYVTLRNGTTCRRFASQSSLDVVDISNAAQPRMVHSQAMDEPYGLGVSGNKLFVCEGDKGLKMLDISKPELPALKHHYTNVPSYDVIALENRLIVTGKNGLFQYSYANNDTLQLLSKIEVQ